MRIALITHQWPGARLGGIGVYTLHCARALADAGHEAHVFTLSLPGDIRSAVPANVVLHEVRSFAERVRAGTVSGELAAGIQVGGEAIYRLAIGAILCEEVRRIHAQTPFDIVEGPEYEGLMLPLMVTPLSPPASAIVHLHSGSAIAHEAAQHSARSGAGDGTDEAIECMAVLAANAVCAPSAQVVRDTEQLCPMGKVTILPLPFYAESRGEDRSGVIRGQSVLFIGRLEILKGAHLIPAAANSFLKDNVDARLRIAGPDTVATPDLGVFSMLEWMRSKLDPALASRVDFLGEQTRAHLAQELAAAAFVIVPSLFDSYSYVCCEALAAGRAIIVSDRIGATEVVADAGIAFERGNPLALAAAMNTLWNDRALRDELSNRALHRASSVLATNKAIEARITFYKQVRESPTDVRPFAEKLASLPPRYIAPLVTALMQLTNFAAGIHSAGLNSPGSRLREILDSLAEDRGRPIQAILFGAGRFTSRLLAESHAWESAGHKIIGLIDDHPRFQSSPDHLGLPVESTLAFQSRLPMTPAPVIILSTDTFQEQFWQQTSKLRALGARVYKL